MNGNTASISVPWDTCTGGQSGYLALPNPSLTADAQVFTVSGSLMVDTNTDRHRRFGPPFPSYTGPVVDATAAEIAPAIRLYGAQLIRVSAANRATSA